MNTNESIENQRLAFECLESLVTQKLIPDSFSIDQIEKIQTIDARGMSAINLDASWVKIIWSYPAKYPGRDVKYVIEQEKKKFERRNQNSV